MRLCAAKSTQDANVSWPAWRTHPPDLSLLPFHYSFLLLLPWAIEALKNSKNYISKQAKWKETLTKLLPPLLPPALPRTGLAACHMKLLYGTYIDKHTMYDTQDELDQQQQHRTCSIFLYVLRLPSDAKSKSKKAKKNCKNFEISLENDRKNYIDIWFMCS